MSEPREWVIYEATSGLFWKSEGRGYGDLTQAGLFAEEAARRIASNPSRQDRAHHLVEYRDRIVGMSARARTLEHALWTIDRRRTATGTTIAVYLAAPYPLRDAARALAALLRTQGIACTSRWLTTHEDAQSDRAAREDLDDIAAADVLVAINTAPWRDCGTGGRHVELGAALMLGVPILLVGERTNVFHRLREITVIDRGADIAAHVRALARGDAVTG